MAEETRRPGSNRALALWHDTTCRLATIVFPLAALLLLTARGIIVTLFRPGHVAGVPIFMIWCLTIIPSALFGRLRSSRAPRTRFLLCMILLRLGAHRDLASAGSCRRSDWRALSAVTLLTTSLVKALGVLQLPACEDVGIGDVCRGAGWRAWRFRRSVAQSRVLGESSRHMAAACERHRDRAVYRDVRNNLVARRGGTARAGAELPST
jgi:hypothetical protein